MPNLILQNEGSIITWLASGGTEAFTPTSLGNAAGRQGAYHDFGAGARCRLFAWRAVIVPGATRVVGQSVLVFFATGDGTNYDNDDGTGDIAVSALDKLRNVQQIGSIVIDQDAAVPMSGHGFIELPHRYGAPIFWNATANALSSTPADFLFQLIEVPDEVQ